MRELRFYNFASRQQAINKFIDYGFEQSDVINTIDLYWKNKHKFSSEEKNIDRLLKSSDGFDVIKSILSKYLKSKKDKLIEDGKCGRSFVLYQDDDYIVWSVEDYKSSQILGDWNDTIPFWSISHNISFWNFYAHYRESAFLFVFKKDFDVKEFSGINRDEQKVSGYLPIEKFDKVALQLVYDEEDLEKIVVWDCYGKMYHTYNCSQPIQDIITKLLKNRILNFTPLEQRQENFLIRNDNMFLYENGKTIWDGDFEVFDWMVEDGRIKFFDNIVIDEIFGKLDCSSCELTELNVPKEVYIFDCSDNKLKNLLGCPEYCEQFDCRKNPLESGECDIIECENFICDNDKEYLFE